MNSRDQETLAVMMRTAVQSTISLYFDKQNADAVAIRKEVKNARKKGIRKETDSWVETYDVRVRHYGTAAGRNAAVTMTGCKRSYDITQVYSGDQYLPKNQRKAPQWNIRIDTQGGDTEYSQTKFTDFEAAVQQSIVGLLGHAYYHLDDE